MDVDSIAEEESNARRDRPSRLSDCQSDTGRVYWFLRRCGLDAPTTVDITQSFFADVILGRGHLNRAEKRWGGRLRACSRGTSGARTYPTTAYRDMFELLNSRFCRVSRM